MKTLSRLSLLIAFAVWLALPTVGNDGGDNAGGTGVWILPRSTFLASGAPMIDPATAARESIQVASGLTSSVTLTASSEMGTMTATMMESTTGTPVALPTNGRNITLSADLLRGIREAGASAKIVVLDGLLQGYVLEVTFASPTSAGEIRIY